MSNKLDLEIKQGEDFFRLLTIKDELGAPINLTGFTFTGQVRATSLTETFLEFTFNVKNQVTNLGQVEMIMSSAVSSKRKTSVKLPLFYDVEMNSGSNKKRILQGSLIFDPEITK